MRLLVTSSRMPFSLDVISKLGECGHEVFTCDSSAAGITRDGQSIPGLPADDAAYLAKLTGEPRG